MKTGGCHCGAVAYTVEGELRDVIYCHCQQCRRQTGHFVAATRCHDDALSVKGSGALTWYDASPDARRGFCSICGALLFWKAHGSDHTSIMAGSFDMPTGLKASHHIFAGDKGDYYEITDGLPVHEAADR